jgi:hypothetical protein
LENTTLRRHAKEILSKAYKAAVRKAAGETRLPESTFPADCPFTLDQILTEELA